MKDNEHTHTQTKRQQSTVVQKALLAAIKLKVKAFKIYKFKFTFQKGCYSVLTVSLLSEISFKYREYIYFKFQTDILSSSSVPGFCQTSPLCVCRRLKDEAQKLQLKLESRQWNDALLFLYLSVCPFVLRSDYYNPAETLENDG